MKYYKDENDQIFADPIHTKGLTEIDSAIKEDGTILPDHKNIGDLEKDELEGFYRFYNQDGSPHLDKIVLEEKISSDLIKVNEALLYLDSTDYRVIKAMEQGKSLDEIYPGESSLREGKRQVVRDLSK